MAGRIDEAGTKIMEYLSVRRSEDKRAFNTRSCNENFYSTRKLVLVLFWSNDCATLFVYTMSFNAVRLN